MSAMLYLGLFAADFFVASMVFLVIAVLLIGAGLFFTLKEDI